MVIDGTVPFPMELFQEYAQLKNQIKAMEDRADEINPQILDHLSAANTDELQVGDLGKFIRAHRRSYRYPAEIEAMVEKLKEDKKESEARGTAHYTEKAYLIFKSGVDNSA